MTFAFCYRSQPHCILLQKVEDAKQSVSGADAVLPQEPKDSSTNEQADAKLAESKEKAEQSQKVRELYRQDF